MRFLSFLPLTLHTAAQGQPEVYDSKTILSITSEDTLIDVCEVPKRLTDAGFEADQKIEAFLRNASVKTLSYAKLQIVDTSNTTVSSDDLCTFLNETAAKLDLMEIVCSKNLLDKQTALDSDLHVNDPNAHKQHQLIRMRMGEVWKLAAPYVRRMVTVAVLDSGINFTDPDLAQTRGIFRKKSGGYYYGGWNFLNDSSVLDARNPHGTVTARLIGATRNNSIDMTGMSPNVRFASFVGNNASGYGSYSAMAESINAAIDIGADVISIGFGGKDRSHFTRSILAPAFREADRNGIIVVAPAGNLGKLADDFYPCALGGSNFMCVAALEDTDDYTVASWSNYGDRVDIAAPGTYVYSGIPTSGSTEYSYGTSWATPLVAGTAALLLSMDVKPHYVKRMITHYAHRFTTPGRPLKAGAGALSPYNVVLMATRYPMFRRGARSLRANMQDEFPPLE
ncbi:Suppressor of the cold-sensitive snRNP bioproteinsis mutant brr1-1 [Perkinsus chesapeaki]|uniref:subtilisin n=1 Tax=Perkinsus chesapeaki TaxID=330153 RepID=A0A7J6N172_PERCH|nr:Suppressor of the cold-sensitive snRNP bioproteinsis mutant brr1-1 [Perkinsus chesapeaki]